VLELFEKTDAFRRPERFDDFLLACEADARGRAGLEDRVYPQSVYLQRAREAAAAATLSPADRTGLDGAAIGQRVRASRLAAIAAVKERG
jgi:tRNA nucleotidyltransferase (CCA-adding enzyme)